MDLRDPVDLVQQAILDIGWHHLRLSDNKAVVLGGAGDKRVDIIVNHRGERVAVQCKNHKKAVGNKPVQEIFRCVEVCVVAPAGYTKGARSTGVSLYDGDAIHRWIKNVDVLERERARTGGASRETERPRGRPTPAREVTEEARKRAIYYPHPDDPPRD